MRLLVVIGTVATTKADTLVSSTTCKLKARFFIVARPKVSEVSLRSRRQLVLYDFSFEERKKSYQKRLDYDQAWVRQSYVGFAENHSVSATLFFPRMFSL